MSDLKNIETLVERAIDTVLNGILPTLREQLKGQVLKALGATSEAPAAASAGAPSGDNSEALNRVQAAVQAGTTQVEILDAMIEGASLFGARSALYVVRGANAVGWKARGFADNEAVRSNPLELSEGLPAKALAARAAVTGLCAEFMPGFEEKVGEAHQGCMVLPLMVRDKVVAILYADGGLEEPHLDASALQSLVRMTGLWLEVFATRKAGGPAAAQAMAAAVATPAPSPSPHEEPGTQTVEESEPEAVTKPAEEDQPQPVAEAVPPLAPEPVAALPAPPAGEDAEVHKKAKRFAKLLVDEIKLYNQGKVTEGRQNRDLYDRLKDDIEKSRTSYEKRYGTTAARDGNYFNLELVRILADNDASLFGNNFRL